MHELIQGLREHLRRVVAGWLDSRLVRRVDASDIVQETLLQTAGRWSASSLPEDSDARRLVYCIAKRRCLDAYRRHVRADRRTVLRERRWADPPSSSPRHSHRHLPISLTSTPGAKVMRKELLKRIDEALGQLGPLDRRVLELRHLQGLDVGQVAARLQMSRTAVTTRHHRAIRELRKLLEFDQ